MNLQNSTQVVLRISTTAVSLRSKLQRYQSRFNDPVLLARLGRQTAALAKRGLNMCAQVDTEEAYDALRELALLVSDFAQVCEHMNPNVHDKLRLLALKLHSEIRYNRRRISAGHPKKSLA